MNERFSQVILFFEKNATSIAKELNVSKTAILRILSGDNLPSSKVLIPLGEKLGVSIDWLLFGEGEMLKNGKTPDIIKSSSTPTKENGNAQLLAEKLETKSQIVKSQAEQIALLKKLHLTLFLLL